MKKLKQIINLLTIAIIIASLTSCGGIKKEHDLTPESVKGGMKDYIDIAPGTYKLTLDETTHDLRLTVKLISKQKTDKSFEEVYNLIMSPIQIQLLDDKGNPPSFGGKMSYTEGSDKLEKLLKDGEENFFSFQSGYSDDEMKDVTLAKFIINTNATEYSKTSSDNSSNNSSSNSSVDCEQFIKDYEAFVNSYVKLLKKYKANPTDMTILNEYTEAAQKAAEMEGNAATCDDPKHAAKLLELANKIAQAAL